MPRNEWEAAVTGGSFEEVFAALEEVVDRLEGDRLPLEEAITCYELGVRLAARCERLLDEAELRVERLEGSAEATDDEIDEAWEDAEPWETAGT